MTEYSQQSMSREDLIASLSESIKPVHRMRPRTGAVLIAMAALVASMVSIGVFKWWSGLLAGEASGYFLITNGLLLVLGTASTAALVKSALPRVGTRASAPYWGAAMLAILPLGAVIAMVSGNSNHAHTGLNDPVALMCTSASLASSALVAVACIAWLRRGAPVSLQRSGWLTGLAAGSLGTVAYGITCELDTFAHVGLWHVVPVAIAAVIGRLAVPPMIRW